MKTKKLIELLQKLDPEGEQEVVAKANDGYAYDIFGAEEGNCAEGIIDDEGEVNCIIIDASN